MKRQSGTFVTPEVKLVRPLNEGAMGSLWVGHHSGLDGAVVVKFIADKLVGDAGALARFQREARAAAQLQSPHVVRTHAYGTTDDRVPYIVMELLEGETLGERLRRGMRLSVDDTVRLVRHVCEALTEAHARGIIHRDIKPDNIFLVRSEGPLQAKVLDFGMAKQATTRGGSIVTATGVIVGTPEYMSPEQVLGSKQVDPRADLWALGVVTYRVLFGDLPFAHDTPHGLIFAICEGQFVAPSARQAPASLDPWFEQALAPQVDRRFESAAAMAEAFAGIVAEAGAELEALGRTVVRGTDDGTSPSQLSDAPTLASALSVREPRVGAPRPAAGRAPSQRTFDPSTLVSGDLGGDQGGDELDGETVERPSPLSQSFGPSSSPDGGTMQSAAPHLAAAPLGAPPSHRASSSPIEVRVEEAAAEARPSEPGLASGPPSAPTSSSPAAVGPARGAPQAMRPERLAQPWADEPAGSALPTQLAARDLRAERARGLRAGWWAVLIIGTAVAAVGVGLVLWLSSGLTGESEVAPAASSAAPAGVDVRPVRRGKTEIGHPTAAPSP